jgi:hypothetical protein
MRKLGLIITLFLFGSLLISSCHSTKHVEKQTSKVLAVDSVFDAMQAHQFSYEWFQGKFSADYKAGDKKQSFSGQFRIRKDSAIWLSIYAVMNIEVFRVIITQDSIYMLNRLKKTYYRRDINFLNDQLGTDIDFDILQSLLIGIDFSYYETDKFTLDVSGDRYKLSTIGRGKLKKYIRNQEDLEMVLVQNMWIDRSDFKIKKQSVRLVKNPNKKVVAQYHEFEDIDGQLFPFVMEFKLVGEKVINLDVKYKSVIINVPQSFPFKVPKKYKRS